MFMCEICKEYVDSQVFDVCGIEMCENCKNEALRIGNLFVKAMESETKSVDSQEV